MNAISFTSLDSAYANLNRKGKEKCVFNAHIFYFFLYNPATKLEKKGREIDAKFAQSPVLEFSIFVTIKSVAPTSVSLSMAMAMSLRSTMA